MTDTIKLSEQQTLRIAASSPEELEVESTWNPGRPPQRHYHPAQHERFEVLAGELTVELNRDSPRVLHVGDTLDVPRRTVHRMWNAGTEPARASWRVTPRLRTEEMFRYIDAGMSPGRVVTMLWRFRKEFRLPLLRRP